jgi:hypothetical protein
MLTRPLAKVSKRMFEKSSCGYQNVFDPPKSTLLAHGGNPQDRSGSPYKGGL